MNLFLFFVPRKKMQSTGFFHVEVRLENYAMLASIN